MAKATTKWPLKTWCGDKSGWCQPLSEATTVCMTDENVPADLLVAGYVKPRFLYLAQTGKTPPVHTSLKGKHLLLTEVEARRLRDYLHYTLDTWDQDDAIHAHIARLKTAKAKKRKTANRKPGKQTTKRGTRRG